MQLSTSCVIAYDTEYKNMKKKGALFQPIHQSGSFKKRNIWIEPRWAVLAPSPFQSEKIDPFLRSEASEAFLFFQKKQIEF